MKRLKQCAALGAVSLGLAVIPAAAQAHPPDCGGNHWDQKAKDLANAGYSCRQKDRGIDVATLVFSNVDWDRTATSCPPGKWWFEVWEMHFSHLNGRTWKYLPKCA